MIKGFSHIFKTENERNGFQRLRSSYTLENDEENVEMILFLFTFTFLQAAE